MGRLSHASGACVSVTSVLPGQRRERPRTRSASGGASRGVTTRTVSSPEAHLEAPGARKGALPSSVLLLAGRPRPLGSVQGGQLVPAALRVLRGRVRGWAAFSAANEAPGVRGVDRKDTKRLHTTRVGHFMREP